MLWVRCKRLRAARGAGPSARTEKGRCAGLARGTGCSDCLAHSAVHGCCVREAICKATPAESCLSVLPVALWSREKGRMRDRIAMGSPQGGMEACGLAAGRCGGGAAQQVADTAPGPLRLSTRSVGD